VYFYIADHMDFFNCLGDLDSCVGRDFVGQDNEILQPFPHTPSVLKNSDFDLVGDSDVNGISPDPERFLLLNPIQGAHEVPRQGSKYSRRTQGQKERDKETRSKKKQANKELKLEKRKAEDDAKRLLEEKNCKKSRVNKQLNSEITDLKVEKVHMLSKLAVRHSVEYYSSQADELKIKLLTAKEALQTHKNEAELSKAELTKAHIAEIKQIKAHGRSAKTMYRGIQEELVARNEQHRQKITAASQENVEYYEDEVAQLDASHKAAELETKVMVDGVATREWGLDYWLGQMKSMMHTTPAATLKLWEYAMVYVEATTAVKRSKDWSPPTSRHLAELRTDAGLVGQICAGVMVAKAKSVLTVFIDETELECSSMQSMITTIVDESDCVRKDAHGVRYEEQAWAHDAARADDPCYD